MEPSSLHRRDSSLSSVGSLMDASTAGFDDVSAESFYGIEPVVPRRRLGAEMAILASSSPEIKALNLPMTPTFPCNLAYPHSNSSRETISSDASSSNNGAAKTTLTPLLMAMDDLDESSSCLSENNDTMRAGRRGITLEKTDDLMLSLGDEIPHTPPTIKPPRTSVFNFVVDNKENIDPKTWKERLSPARVTKAFGYNRTNIRESRTPPRHCKKIDSRNGRDKATSSPKIFGTDRTNRRGHHLQRPLKHSLRSPMKKPSLHRRVSHDSLPSPSEIIPIEPQFRQGPFEQQMPPLSSQPIIEGIFHRNLRRDTRRELPKNMALSTGFR